MRLSVMDILLRFSVPVQFDMRASTFFEVLISWCSFSGPTMHLFRSSLRSSTVRRSQLQPRVCIMKNIDVVGWFVVAVVDDMWL